MNHHLRLAGAALITTLLTACAAPVVHDTPSHKAEVTILNYPYPDKIRGHLEGALVNLGFNPGRETQSTLVLDKPVQNVFMAALMGSQYDAQPDERITLTFLSYGNTLRIIGDVSVITNPGSAFERRTDWNATKDSQNLQYLLDGVADLANRGRLR